jgi:Domain of unknown function (DUF4158)
MPVSFLTPAQRERYGRYPASLSADELARYFYLGDDDREWISQKCREATRLGIWYELFSSVRSLLDTIFRSCAHFYLADGDFSDRL